MHLCRFVLFVALVVGASCHEKQVQIIDGTEIHRLKRDTENTASASLERIRLMGTKFNADYQGRLWTSSDRRTQLEAVANYNRQFGGRESGKQDYSAGIQLKHEFN